MIEVWKKVDNVSRAGISLLISFTLLICWLQSYFWETNDEYSFGYIVPLFVLYIIYDRWPQIKNSISRDAGSPAEGSGRVINFLTDIFAFLTICFGLVFMLSGVMRRISDGPSELGAFIASMGFTAFFLGIIYIVFDKDWNGRSKSFKQRIEILGFFLFPALIWLVSVPMVGAMHQEVRLFLLSKVVVAVVVIFEVFGNAIEQSGNVLSFADNSSVGVEDACSGIRSLTSCIFAGSFLAAVFMDRFWKKVLYIGLAILFAFFTNIIRSLFLTTWVYSYGSESLDDIAITLLGNSMSVHDLAGYSVMVITIISLLCLMPLFLIKATPPNEE